MAIKLLHLVKTLIYIEWASDFSETIVTKVSEIEENKPIATWKYHGKKHGLQFDFNTKCYAIELRFENLSSSLRHAIERKPKSNFYASRNENITLVCADYLVGMYQFSEQLFGSKMSLHHYYCLIETYIQLQTKKELDIHLENQQHSSKKRKMEIPTNSAFELRKHIPLHLLICVFSICIAI